MIKLTRILFALIILTACNSKEKKKNTVDYPDKTSLAQVKPGLKESIARGKLVYNDMCTTCHLTDGKGVPRAFPPLVNSDYLRENQDKSIKGIKNGMSGEIIVNGITYNGVMAPLGLSDEEVADVMNYINNSWGNKIDNFITPEKVSKL
ncbi:cytochrome c [Winogradskyella echinorum]|uniref:Cytochrome c n=1 Tax=Winogradskyella echinorum TaxID=538189 RepID=A0ABR6Y2C3_9FLAO|nr:cytochrome c [Winogradskyella echinorum]MBC3846891.1 cytochrome c [Winogradskyella echinorum]MBC5751239.1 cytochrome c [Winogradskyella echinorum]